MSEEPTLTELQKGTPEVEPAMVELHEPAMDERPAMVEPQKTPTTKKGVSSFLDTHSKALRRTILVIIGIILGLNVYFTNANTLVGNKLPMPFGYGISTVMSNSMVPAFSAGDMLIVREGNNCNVGDVVVYQYGGQLISHRVIAVSEDEVLTKGDANKSYDPEVPRENVLGVVVSVVPYVGSVAAFLKTPIGAILALAIAIFLVEFSARRDRKEALSENEAIREEIERLKALETESSPTEDETRPTPADEESRKKRDRTVGDATPMDEGASDANE